MRALSRQQRLRTHRLRRGVAPVGGSSTLLWGALNGPKSRSRARRGDESSRGPYGAVHAGAAVLGGALDCARVGPADGVRAGRAPAALHRLPAHL